MEIAIDRTRTTFFRAALYSGLIGGLAFVLLDMLLVAVFMGESIWTPPRMIAAIILGESALPSPVLPSTFNLGVILIALSLHFALSITYAMIIDGLIRSSRMSGAILIGAVAGLTIYVINFYGFTAAFPWFASARNWISIVAHLVFGIVVASTFVRIYHPNVKEHRQ